MISIKGFIENAAYIDNAASSVAYFGELSNYSRTFAKDSQTYSRQIYPGLEWTVFHHKKAGAHNGIVNPMFIDKTLKLATWVFNQSTSMAHDTTKPDYLAAIGSALGSDVENIAIGRIVHEAGKTIPEWVSYRVISTEANEIKIWLANTAFERDYDEFEITVISPLANVDTLFRPVSEIRTALGNRTLAEQLENVQTVKAKLPETALRLETVQYINPVDNNITFDLNWYILVYGPMGNNSEAIKQAIIDYIMAHTSETEAAWKQILPFLFRVTRMYVIPRWDRIAIASRQSTVGIYSPITSVKENLTHAKTALSHLANAFVEEHLQVTHHKFRSVTLLTCGGEDNAQDKFKLTDYVPDYIAESSTSPDYSRMSETSKRFTVLMEELLIMAENFDAVAGMPVNTRKVRINNVDYVGRKLGQVEYLVAIKE